MLRKKALRKIFVTTMSIFIVIAICFIKTTDSSPKTLATNLELEYISGLGNHSIYLLNEENYLVKVKILLDNEDQIENIKTILSNLTIGDNTKYPDSLKALIPKGTKVLSVDMKDDVVIIDFSKEFNKVVKEDSEKMIEAIVFSITELKDINGVQIKVEGQELDKYPNTDISCPTTLTRQIGINKHYQLTGRNNINKVVIYYNEKIDDNIYYVPVTKYKNDDRNKITILIEELTTGYIYEPNLMSLVNENTELLGVDTEGNLMTLDFNESLLDIDGTIKEEVIYTLGYGVFENYDVEVLSLKVNGKEKATIKKSDLP